MYSPIQCDNQCFSLQPSNNVLARNIARIARYSILFSCIPARSCKILWDIGILQQDSCKILAQDLARYCRNAGERDFFLEYLAILAIFLVRAFLLGCKEKHCMIITLYFGVLQVMTCNEGSFPGPCCKNPNISIERFVWMVLYLSSIVVILLKYLIFLTKDYTILSH